MVWVYIGVGLQIMHTEYLLRNKWEYIPGKSEKTVEDIIRIVWLYSRVGILFSVGHLVLTVLKLTSTY